VYSYEVFLPLYYERVLEIGDTLELTINGTHTVALPIVGIDVTDRHALVVWL